MRRDFSFGNRKFKADLYKGAGRGSSKDDLRSIDEVISFSSSKVAGSKQCRDDTSVELDECASVELTKSVSIEFLIFVTFSEKKVFKSLAKTVADSVISGKAFGEFLFQSLDTVLKRTDGSSEDSMIVIMHFQLGIGKDNTVISLIDII